MVSTRILGAADSMKIPVREFLLNPAGPGDLDRCWGLAENGQDDLRSKYGE